MGSLRPADRPDRDAQLQVQRDRHPILRLPLLSVPVTGLAIAADRQIHLSRVTNGSGARCWLASGPNTEEPAGPADGGGGREGHAI